MKLLYNQRGSGLVTSANKCRSDLTVSKIASETPKHYFCRSQRNFMLKLSVFTSTASVN